MDWTDTGYSYNVEVAVVSQTNVDETLGMLNGVVYEGLTVGENYNSDSRVQGKVTTVVAQGTSDGYVENARLRIILTVPSRSWSEELMTGYVSNISESNNNGYVKRTYTIESTIWGLLDHLVNTNIIIGKGARLINVWTRLLNATTRMQHKHDRAVDHRFSTNIVYEAGSSLGTILFEVASGYNRMEVDGHGRLVLEKYVAPSRRNPSDFLDLNDIRGLTLYPLDKSSSKWEAPGRAIVTSVRTVTNRNGKSSQQTIVGCYDAPSSNKTSIGARGWLKARRDTYSGTSGNPSVSELNAIAKRNWQNAQNNGDSWTCTSVFKDYHAGDVLTFIVPSKQGSTSVKSKKVLVTAVTTNLESMTQDLSLKEV